MTPSSAPAARGLSSILFALALMVVLGTSACATVSNTGNEKSFRARTVSESVTFVQSGQASFYARKFKNRRTANGERYNPDGYTAAHPRFAFGTLLLVKRKRTGRYVVVRVNDRGPHVGGRVLDLSTAAARKLGILGRGVADVDVYKVDPSSGYASAL